MYRQEISIYIPLCFYLYGNVPRCVFPGDWIYIPLCFYLYGDCRKRIDKWYFIYIPLCFYLYVFLTIKIPGSATFTFHYASTYTTVLRYIVITVPHLHSTMLLLIHRLCEQSLLIELIYIPLCFYLYHPGLASKGHARNNLHSTMLLLILTMLNNGSSAHSHLHSTMLLLIPRSSTAPCAILSNLHSTMLLLIPVLFQGLYLQYYFLINCRPLSVKLSCFLNSVYFIVLLLISL